MEVLLSLSILILDRLSATPNLGGLFPYVGDFSRFGISWPLGFGRMG